MGGFFVLPARVLSNVRGIKHLFSFFIAVRFNGTDLSTFLVLFSALFEKSRPRANFWCKYLQMPGSPEKYNSRVGCQLDMFIKPALLHRCDVLLIAWTNYGTASEIARKLDDLPLFNYSDNVTEHHIGA
jgi:hypothetical protein